MAKKDFIVLIGLLAVSISTDAYASLDVDTQRALAPAAYTLLFNGERGFV